MAKVGKVADIGRYHVTPPPLELKGEILGVRDLQDRGRVQVPKIVREKLGLKKNGRIYFIEFEGRIYIAKAVKIT